MRRSSVRRRLCWVTFAALMGAVAVGCVPPPENPGPADPVPNCTPGDIGEITLGENPVDVPTGFNSDDNLVDVCWNFGPAGAFQAVFIHQCNQPHDRSEFVVSFMCSNQTSVNINPQSNPTGSGHAEFKVFRGPEPSGDHEWGLFAVGDVVPAETIQPFTTGYIRVTLGTALNNSGARSTPYTYLP